MKFVYVFDLCNTLPGQKKLTFRFKSANCSAMIWGCFSRSGLGTASQQSSWMYWMTNVFFLPWWLGHIPGQQCQDSSGSSCERVEHEDTWVSGSMRSHFHTWIGHHFTPLKFIEMCWKRLKEWFDSPVINTKSRPKINAMEKNIVTLHKVVKTMPQQMCSVIKAKGGPTKY